MTLIRAYTTTNGYTAYLWYSKIALPVSLFVYLFLNILLCVKFFKVNKLIKTSIVLFLINSLYLIAPFVKVKNLAVQEELDDLNIFLADLSNWKLDVTLDNNIHCLIFVSLLAIGVVFLIFGLVRHVKRKKQP